MSKLRVYEYAKKQNVSSKEIITKLKTMNIEVTNHMSTIDGETAGKLDSLFKGNSNQVSNESKKQATPIKQQPRREQPRREQPARGERAASGTNQQNRPSHNRGQQAKPNAGQERKQHKPNNEQTSSAKQQNSGNPRNHEMGQNKTNMKTSQASHQNKNQQQRSNNNNSNNKGFNKNKKGNAVKNKQRQKPQQHQPAPQKQKELPEKITFSGSLSVAELAKKLHREPSELIKKLFLLGVIATINQELDKDAIELICTDYGVEVEEEIQIDTTDLEVYFTEDDEG